MLKCDICQENLTAWLDGELSRELQHRIQTHLTECADCSRVLRLHRQERSWLQKHQFEIDLPPQLWVRIERELDQEASGKETLWERLAALLHPYPLRGYQKAWAGVATSLFLVVSFLLVFQQTSTPPSDQAIRQSMEQYIRWRESQTPLITPGIVKPASTVHELKSANPFLEDNAPVEERNPFEI